MSGIAKMMKSAFKKHTYGLHKKIYIAILFVGLTLLISLSFIIFIVARSGIRAEMEMKLQNQTQQVGNMIDAFMRENKNAIISVSLNEDISNLMSGNYYASPQYIVYNNIYRLIGMLTINNPWRNYYIFTSGDKALLSSDRNNIASDYTLFHPDRYEWYNDVIRSTNNLVLLDNFIPPVNPTDSKFAIALRVEDTSTAELRGFLVISMEKSYFDDILQNTSFASIDSLLITNSAGNIVYSFSPDNEIGDSDIINILESRSNIFSSRSGRKYLIHLSQSSETGWNIIYLSDEKAIETSIYNLYTAILVVTACSIGLLLILSYVISSNFTKPVKRLMKLMRKAEAKGYMVVADANRNDEIGDLSHEFNVMIKRVLENQVLLKDAEINALQQQINPHFLYNTLDCIRTLAAMDGKDEICLMIERLSSMFRYNINREKTKVVHIEEEIRHVENYIYIQKICYSNRLTVEYAIDSAIYRFLTLKFILQPIVENAIYHGMRETNDITIMIGGRREGNTILFEITDNGSGMDANTLRMLNDYIHGGSLHAQAGRRMGMGLRNIQQRLLLFFGEGFGMNISSQPSGGTKVTLQIPSWKEEEVSHIV